MYITFESHCEHVSSAFSHYQMGLHVFQKETTDVDRVFRCLKCDKPFRRVHNLNSHMKMSHANEKELLHEQTEVNVPDMCTHLFLPLRFVPEHL